MYTSTCTFILLLLRSCPQFLCHFIPYGGLSTLDSVQRVTRHDLLAWRTGFGAFTFGKLSRQSSLGNEPHRNSWWHFARATSGYFLPNKVQSVHHFAGAGSEFVLVPKSVGGLSGRKQVLRTSPPRGLGSCQLHLWHMAYPGGHPQLRYIP